MLVNCTAVGLDGSRRLDGLPLDAGAVADFGCVVDLVYTPGGTALVRAARAHGVPAVDGLELLIGQGALLVRDLHRRGRLAVRDAGGGGPGTARRLQVRSVW